MKVNAGLNCNCDCTGEAPCSCRCDHCGALASDVERLTTGDPMSYWPWICSACVARYGGQIAPPERSPIALLG